MYELFETTSLQLFFHNPLSSEKIYLEDFLVILKPSELQENIHRYY